MLPLYKEIVLGHDSYHINGALAQLAATEHAQRAWLKGSTYASVQLKGGGVVKSLEQFDRHGHTEDSFMAFLEECLRYEVSRPSSYSDVFHQLFSSPRIAYTVNRYLAPYFAGAWQEARVVGVVAGPLFRYDLNSAYLWSGSQGLPIAEGFRYTERLTGNALCVVDIEPNPDAPHPFNRRSIVLAQPEDVDLYNLRVNRVVAGIRWNDNTNGDEILGITQRFSFWKQIGRAYWGRWAAQQPLKCRSYRNGAMQKQWELGNPALNFVWAQLIINRVKRKIYEYDACPVHVFVDAVITRHRLPVSDGVGGWRADGEFPVGLHIVGPGIYGVPGGTLLKRAGLPAGTVLDSLQGTTIVPKRGRRVPPVTGGNIWCRFGFTSA